MTTFRKYFSTAPKMGLGNALVKIGLASVNLTSHVNLVIEGGARFDNLTLTPEDATKLRDLLIEAYPVTAPKPSKFKVGDKVTYRSKVGYGARGMDGRTGTISKVKDGEWYEADFGTQLGALVPVHSDYLEAAVEFKAGDRVRYKSGKTFSNGQKVGTLDRRYYGLSAERWYLKETQTHVVAVDIELAPADAAKGEPRKIAVGDTVRRLKGGSWTLPEGTVSKVVYMSPTGSSLRVAGNTALFDTEYFELVHADPVEAVKAAIPTIQNGRFVVIALENGAYVPGSKPKLHVTDVGAQVEAERLAREVGGTYHVFKATFEASREKPIIPPVKTAKL